MNWLHETLASDLSLEQKEDAINHTFKELHLEGLEAVLDSVEGYKGVLGAAAVTLCLYDAIKVLRAEVEAGL